MIIGLLWIVGAIGFLLMGIGLGMSLEADRWRANAYETAWLESGGRVFTVEEQKI